VQSDSLMLENCNNIICFMIMFKSSATVFLGYLRGT
jgi:hypothetical protein